MFTPHYTEIKFRGGDNTCDTGTIICVHWGSGAPLGESAEIHLWEVGKAYLCNVKLNVNGNLMKQFFNIH